jgi:hypothetical protein
MKILIVATGNYSRPLPEALARALEKEIWNQYGRIRIGRHHSSSIGGRR